MNIDNLIIGKIVATRDSLGTSYDVRIVDKKRTTGGADYYVFVKTDGTSFSNTFFDKIHDRETSVSLWNQYFVKYFSDNMVNIM